MERARRRVLLVAALAGLAVAAGAGPARAQAPERVQLGYDISVAGIHVIDFDLSIAIDDRSYDVSTVFKTHGVLDWILQWHNVSQSVGTLKADGRVRPERYEATGSFRGNRREVRFDYRGGEIGGVELVPPLAEDNEREPVTREEMGEAQDPAAMLFAVIRRVSAGQPCSGVVPVFDGRRRFDLEFVDRGVEVVEAAQPGGYAGEARRCDFTFRIVAGFMRYVTSGPDRQREPRHGRVWLAEVVKGKPLAPVRIELDNSNWGRTVARLRPATPDCETAAAPPTPDTPAAPAQC